MKIPHAVHLWIEREKGGPGHVIVFDVESEGKSVFMPLDKAAKLAELILQWRDNWPKGEAL